MIIEIMLAASALLNLFLLWYSYRSLKTILEISEQFDEFRTKMVEFATHLKAINKVESFYGDPTITALIEHMKRLAVDIEEYAQMLIIYEDDMEDENEQKEN
ncbi:MAG: hypothetical protein GOVbin703_59 [Prokaryotic dsDNA virus sp.]|nr:MAG: hypothetical protein GOVbin703_59 [Prokaryotic dsDNA virus sp.]|tara:strand:+ start:5502 stop:5807 length:306 start_codon:yes stop_codon:yes gene_type:complete